MNSIERVVLGIGHLVHMFSKKICTCVHKYVSNLLMYLHLAEDRGLIQ